MGDDTDDFDFKNYPMAAKKAVEMYRACRERTQGQDRIAPDVKHAFSDLGAVALPELMANPSLDYLRL